MKEACINRIYSVKDQVPQFSFTTLLHEVTPRSRQIGKIRPIVVLFCCYPQSFKHKKQTNKENRGSSEIFVVVYIRLTNKLSS